MSINWHCVGIVSAEWAFDVKVLPTQKKIQPGDATLRFFPAYFSLTSGNPCTCLGYWMHNQLRKYGGSAGFSFEAGSKCYGRFHLCLSCFHSTSVVFP